MLGSRKRLFVALMLGFVALGPIARAVLDQGNAVWHEYSYLGGMDAIALGCLTALALSSIHLGRRQVWWAGLSGMALLAVSMGFRIPALAHTGLNMSIVAIGTCLVIAASAQGTWRSPAVLRPLASLGQRSYETYLTHMFVVFTFFQLFLRLGKPTYAVPLLFTAVIFVAGCVGALTARFYSEPLNALLRARWQMARRRLDSGPLPLERAIEG